ncbi:MAG: type I DNA topoisomerase [Candidatus Moranbacteria bacterium]|nr:type I DNA topoisomerase [Candidatus Moranbacteria bacterium]
MKLLIVESPTKAKTISRFLGKDYKVRSSYGHVMDLPKNKLGVDPENNFQPDYIIPEKAEKNIKELEKIAPKAETVVLATDEDREGEAISWHLVRALDLKKSRIQRIVFHEITNSAIQEALKNPQQIDMRLVDAQQARRVLDRLVGYQLSPLLWKKIRKGLSAGRVQSVAVRLVVEREREIEKFNPQEYWEISADLKRGSEPFNAKLWKKNGKIYKKLDVKNQKEAGKIKGDLESSDFEIESISKKEISKNPPPPFTTSTLQQTANSAFGFSAKQTMRLAQQLYEGVALEGKRSTGLITYMRTDSLNVSRQAQESARKLIKEKFGDSYCPEKPRFYKTKSKGAQEAHEAIRPTFPQKDPESVKQYMDSRQYKLYRLIWQRMIASQMEAAKIDSTAAAVKAQPKSGKDEYSLKATGSVIKFEGYMKLAGKKDDRDNLLPTMQEGDKPKLVKINSEQKFTQPPARYSEAALVKALEENGIGRPSTYAPTISTIQTRGYIDKDENKKLLPTDIGTLVNDLLVAHFPRIVDYQFTAEMESSLDKIAEGENDWTKVVEKFYNPFKKNLKMKEKEIKKEDFQKKLGRKCPECGGELVEKFGKFGKFIACKNYPDCKYTEKSQEDKDLEKEVMKQEGGSKGEVKCDKCGAKMEVKKGPYGPFLGCSNYPQCKNIKKVENKIGVKCPECGKDLVEKKSKKGKTFYGCSGYPNCNAMFWNKPTGKKCPKCKTLLVQKGKKTACSNKECGYVKN